MNLQSLVVVVLRLMALDFLLRGFLQLPVQMAVFLRLSHSPEHASQVMLSCLVFALLIVCAVILWFLAFPIARLVTRGVAQDISFGTMSLVDCYSIAFITVGLIYFVKGLPLVLNWVPRLFKAASANFGTEWKEGVDGYETAQIFIPFIAGLILFIYGRRWAIKLAQRQAEVETRGSAVTTPQE